MSIKESLAIQLLGLSASTASDYWFDPWLLRLLSITVVLKCITVSWFLKL